MTAKAFALQEAKVLFTGTAYSDAIAFTDGDSANWVHDGTDCFKARMADGVVDLSGLVQPRITDPSARTRLRGRGDGILGRRVGTFTTSHFLNSSTADSFVKTLLGKVLGGVATPTLDFDTLDAGSHTTTQLNITDVEANTGIAEGHAVLCGDNLDGRGGGEVIPVETVAASALTLSRATAVAMNDSDVIFVSHTVYPDPDIAMQYANWFFIGDDSTSPDQFNCVGCACTGISFSGLNMGADELPIVQLEWSVGDWRYEPAASKGTVAHTTTPKGADPAMDRSIGGLWVTDSGSAQARGYFLGGQFEIDPDFVTVPLLDPQYANGIGGFAKVPGFAKWGFTAYSDEGSPDQPVPELQDEYEAGTSKQVCYQFGHAEDACCAISIDKGYVDETLKRTELNSMAAWQVKGHAEEYATTTDLIAGDFKIHFFHS
jgi:hypothetical protein